MEVSEAVADELSISEAPVEDKEASVDAAEAEPEVAETPEEATVEAAEAPAVEMPCCQSIKAAVEATPVEATPVEATPVEDFEELSIAEAVPAEDSVIFDESESNAVVDQAFNEIFQDGELQVSNDDEDEIWRKLQKDIVLDEEQQDVAATRIQSSFRGYMARKALKQEGEHVVVISEVDTDVAASDDQKLAVADESVSGVVDGDQEIDGVNESQSVHEALAGLTETVTKVALFLTSPLQIADKQNVLDTDNGGAARGGESVDLNDTIATKLNSSSHVLPSDIHDLNCPTDDTEHRSAEAVAAVSGEGHSADQELVFELFVESNETTNDGLVESYWMDDSLLDANDQPIKPCGVTVFIETCSDHGDNDDLHDGDWTDTSGSAREDVESPTIMDHQLAATKIQAGYRGYQARKMIKRKKHLKAIADASTEQEAERTKKKLHEAAAKIQAGFRGYKVRREMDSNSPRWTQLQNRHKSSAADQSPASNLQSSCSIDELGRADCDYLYQHSAATKIQAGVRGFLVRRRQQKLRQAVPTASGQPKWLSKHRGVQSRKNSLSDYRRNSLLYEIIACSSSSNSSNKSSSLSESFLPKSEVNTNKSQPSHVTDLLDDAQTAATKIQAVYRGYRVRRQFQLKPKPKSKIIAQVSQCDSVDDDSEKQAAIVIQAGYRGYRARKQVQNFNRKKK